MYDFSHFTPPKELTAADYRITLHGNLYLGSRAAYRGMARRHTGHGTVPEETDVFVIFRNRQILETEIPRADHAWDASRLAIPCEGQIQDQTVPLTAEIFKRGAVLHTEDPTDDQFEITSFCGMGGFGEVWAADWQRADQRNRVAIKFPHTATPVSAVIGESPLLRQLLEQEQLRGLGRIVIRHHGCLTIDQRKNPGWPKQGLVMDCAKGTLRDYLNEHKPDINTAAAICRRLITLVSDFHRLGYVHCDLKSDNLLFHPDYHPEHLLIGDVGTATPHGDRHTITLRRNGENGGADTAEWTEDALQLGIIFNEIRDKLLPHDAAQGQWLSEIIGDLTKTTPTERARLDRSLLLKACPDTAEMRNQLAGAGWPVGHPEFQRLHGREWLRAAFISFCQAQTKRRQGGLFLISGDAGMGKTAIVTEWCLLPHCSLDTDTQLPLPLHPQRLCPAVFVQKKARQPSQPEQLWMQLASQLSTAWPAHQDPNSDQFRDLLQTAAKNLPENQPLIVLIDGIDHAEQPRNIVDFLRSICTKDGICGLPHRVFLVVTTNPVDAQGQSLTDALKSMPDGVAAAELQVHDHHSRRDMLKLWQTECRYRLPMDSVQSHAAQAEQALRAAAGSPMILCAALREIAAGTLTLDKFLRKKVPTTVMHWHRDRWNAVLQASTADWDRLYELTALLTIAREPVTTAQLAFWMNSPTASVQRYLERLSAILSSTSTTSADRTARPERRWMLYHESLRIFFTEKCDQLRSLIGSAHGELARRLLPADQSRLAPDHASGYALRHVVAHLLAEPHADIHGRPALQQAIRLLTDPAFLEARLTATRSS